ncbi:MAG: protein kinase [Planctomycetota bacterium]
MANAHGPGRAARINDIVDRFVARYCSGDPLHAEDLVDAHGDIADELAERLAAAEELLRRTQPATASHEAETSRRTDVGASNGPTGLSLVPGVIIAGYDITRIVHHGGQGVVCQAAQHSTGRTVAVKLLLGGSAASDANKKRFGREIELLANLKHPNIVTIFDSGTTSTGTPFYVMDYVDGLPLHDYVRQAKLDVDAVLKLFQVICRAVNYAHQRAVIHRDLKPSNILVDREGNPRVLDFGLAKAIDDVELTAVSASGQVIGTISYMSPEQARGSADLDIRTDIYSLGIILYEVLTGHHPYAAGGHPTDVLQKVTQTPPTSPSRLWREDGGVAPPSTKQRPRGHRCPIDQELDTIVLKTLAKEPDRRYQSMDALAADMDRYLRNFPIEAKRDSRMYVLRKGLARHKAAVFIATACAILITALAAAMTVLYFRADAERERADRRAADLRRSAYFHSIALAQHAINERNVTQLKKLLRDCPPDLRGWEWRHLWRMSDSSRATLQGHEDSVTCVVFGPGSQRICSASRDGTVRLWDASTEAERLRLTASRRGLEALAVSPDGAYIAAGGYGRTVQLWDVATEAPTRELTGHEGTVTSLAFSPNGERVVSGGQDSRIRVWDVATGKLAMVLAGHEGNVSCVAYSPGAHSIVSVGGDKVIRLWDANSGDQISVFRGHTERITSVAMSTDGGRIVSGGWDRTVRVWDVATGEQTLRMEHEDANVNDVCFSPDGTHIASISYRSIRVWDAVTGTTEAVFLGHEKGGLSVAFSCDGMRLVSGGHDNVVKVWDVNADPEPYVLGVQDGLVGQVAVSPDGTRIASAARDDTITVWDAVSHQIVNRWTGQATHALAFSPEGRRLVSAGRDRVIKVWDADTGAELLSFGSHGARVTSTTYAPNGKLIASAGADHKVKLWAAQTGVLSATLAAHDAEVTCVAFSPTGDRLASGSADRTIRVWDLDTHVQRCVMLGHTRGVNCVAFSPDGTRVVSGSEDRTVRLWDAESGDAVHVLFGHEAIVMAVAFSPNSERVLSAGFDGNLRLWAASTGKPALTLPGHTGPVTSAVFSPDGSWIASGSADRTVRIWNAPQLLPPSPSVE